MALPVTGLPARPLLSYKPPDPPPPLFRLPNHPSGPPSSVLPLKPVSSVLNPSLPLRPSSHKRLLPIGMNPDPDPYSTHGIFRCASHPNRRTYVPNPARSLVMEEIPKAMRNRDFVNSWCKKAGATHPLYLELDAKGKALVEFASAEMARAAFASPRLQGGQGKGSIRVWWYRVDGVGAGAGVGEIEEGEIEDDAEMYPVRQERNMQKNARMKGKKKQTREMESRATPHATFAPHNAQFNFQVHPNINPLPPFELTALNPNGLAYSRGPSSLDKYGQPARPSLDGSTKQPCNDTHPTCDAPAIGSPLPSDDDHTSIASSRPGSPLLEPCKPPTSEDVNGLEEHMDVDLPMCRQHPNGSSDSTVEPHLDIILAESTIPSQPASSTALLNQHGLLPIGLPCQTIASDLKFSSLASSTSTTGFVSLMSTPTPPDTPSDTRAIKGPPTAPNYTKRSLLARQRDLQERIARSKLELNKASTQTSPNITPSEVAPIVPASPAIPDADKDANQASVEDNLRRLVLDSKRNRAANLIMTTTVDAMESDSEVTSLSLPGSHTTSNTSPMSRESASPIPALFGSPMLSPTQETLDDLAISFITEAIQTVKPLQTRPSPALVKHELAVKQQKLEQHIAESKLLMAKLNSAQTKQERDVILRVMRERSRCVFLQHVKGLQRPLRIVFRMMEADLKSPTLTNTMKHNFATKVAPRVRWPETPQDAGVLIVSDEEDEL